MTKASRYLPLIVVTLCCMAWASCTQERQPCLTPKSATLNLKSIHFKSDTAKQPVDTLLPLAVFVPLSKDSITGYSFPAKSSAFPISLSPDSVSCQWLFKADTSITSYDTITFFYRRNLQFLSNACGYTYFFDLDSVRSTNKAIDSVHILNTSVTNDVKPMHVQVYIHRNF